MAMWRIKKIQKQNMMKICKQIYLFETRSFPTSHQTRNITIVEIGNIEWNVDVRRE